VPPGPANYRNSAYGERPFRTPSRVHRLSSADSVHPPSNASKIPHTRTLFGARFHTPIRIFIINILIIIIIFLVINIITSIVHQSERIGIIIHWGCFRATKLIILLIIYFIYIIFIIIIIFIYIIYVIIIHILSIIARRYRSVL
jgi:hypothetical protein